MVVRGALRECGDRPASGRWQLRVAEKQRQPDKCLYVQHSTVRAESQMTSVSSLEKKKTTLRGCAAGVRSAGVRRTDPRRACCGSEAR